jgi:hypothetical protein
MTEPTPIQTPEIEAAPAEDATAVLDVSTLPAGVVDPTTIPIPMGPRDPDVPLTLDDAIVALAEAAIGIDALFDRPQQEAAADAQLEDFIRRATIDGIVTVAPSAITAKREQIKEHVARERQDRRLAFQRARAVVGRLLHDARREAIAKPIGPYRDQSPGQGLVAHQTDLLETWVAEQHFERYTLPQLVEAYERTPDSGNRALMRFIESGRRPVARSDADAAAAVKLARLVRERQAARIPPALRRQFAHFASLTGSVRRAKEELLA